jgi:hypothetical protein
MNQTSGISEDLVENYQECKELIASLTCCICLEIVENPYECENCESLYCFECWDLMKISGKNCVYNCKSQIIKAKKFIFDMLSKIRFFCENCEKHNIPYNTYLRHMQICKLNTKYLNTNESENLIREKSSRIEEIQKLIEKEKLQPIENNNSIGSFNLLKDKEKLRKKYIVNLLSSTQKKELYNSVSEGNIEKFKSLILVNKFNILEEISATGYFWTSFHYAMHYGKLNIILFIMETLSSNDTLEEVMRLESNDGRCPLMCLIKSNSLNSSLKKSMLESLFQKFKFMVSNEIVRELKNRDFNNMIEKFNLKVLN